MGGGYNTVVGREAGITPLLVGRRVYQEGVEAGIPQGVEAGTLGERVPLRRVLPSPP